MGELIGAPEYNDHIPELESGDRGYADAWNARFKRLLDNDAYLEKKRKEIDRKISELDQAIRNVNLLRASLEEYGMVKVTNSSAVTDSVGLALAATEKNATIEGTLANKLSLLNTDYGKLSRGIRFYDSGHLPGDITISSDGEWFIFKKLIILEGDLVIMSGTCSNPYGSFGVMMQQGNYTPISFAEHGSNSIDASNIMLHMTSVYTGDLRLRLTAPGTKLSDNSALGGVRITVISCRSFYL